MLHPKLKITCLFLLILNSQMCVTLDSHTILHALGRLIDTYQTSCEQNQDCADNGTAGTSVPDPLDCHKYYLCVRVDEDIVASDEPLSCPEDEYFNSVTSACETEIQPCTNTCDQRCSLVCSEELDLVPYPGNCSAYEICLIGGGTQVESCPIDRPYFNGADCTANSSLCCDLCILNCEIIGIQIPDPCDCRKYYICNDLGVPPENTHGMCSNGEVFNPTVGTCVSGNDCEPVCSSGICTNSTTSTPFSTFLSSTTNSYSTSSPIISTTSTITTSTTSIPSTFVTSSLTTSTIETSTAEITTSETTTPTTISSTTSSISTTTAPPCLDSMTCVTTGKFVRCNNCSDTYFLCTGVDEPASIETCPDGQVFNTNPNYPFCLDPDECPYPSL